MKINQLFLTAVFTLAALSSSIAQEVQWGVKAGGNLSTLTGAPEGSSTTYRPGFHAGLVAEFRLSEKVSIQPELLYSMEGGKNEMSFDEEDFSFFSKQELKTSYLNLPVMAKYFVTPALSLEGGPQLGYLLTAEADYEMRANFLGETPINESGTEDFKDDAKTISFGLNFGLGYQLQNGLFFQGRYHLGLTDLGTYEVADGEFEEEIESIKNRGFQLSLGYKF